MPRIENLPYDIYDRYGGNSIVYTRPATQSPPQKQLYAHYTPDYYATSVASPPAPQPHHTPLPPQGEEEEEEYDVEEEEEYDGEEEEERVPEPRKPKSKQQLTKPEPKTKPKDKTTQQPTLNTKESKPMTPVAQKSVSQMVVSNLQESAKISSAGTVNKRLVEVVLESAGDAIPEALREGVGRDVLEVALPIALYAVVTGPGADIPQAEKIARVADYASKASMIEQSSKLLSGLTSILQPAMRSIAAMEKGLPKETKTPPSEKE